MCLKCGLSVLNGKSSECLKNYFLGSRVNYASHYAGVKRLLFFKRIVAISEKWKPNSETQTF